MIADADIRTKNLFGVPPIATTGARIQVESVRYLLELGVDVDEDNERGYTALYGAGHNGHLEVVRLLLEADRELKTGSRATPLEIAQKSSSHWDCGVFASKIELFL